MFNFFKKPSEFPPFPEQVYDPDDPLFFRKINEEDLARWIESGVVRTIKWYTADDPGVCPDCSPYHGKIFPIRTKEEQDQLRQLLAELRCSDSQQCRCYLRPEDISIDL